MIYVNDEGCAKWYFRRKCYRKSRFKKYGERWLKKMSKEKGWHGVIHFR